MTFHEFSQLYAGLIALVWGAILLSAAPLGAYAIYLHFSAMRNVKLIRVQLERMNDRLAARDAAGL